MSIVAVALVPIGKLEESDTPLVEVVRAHRSYRPSLALLRA